MTAIRNAQAGSAEQRRLVFPSQASASSALLRYERAVAGAREAVSQRDGRGPGRVVGIVRPALVPGT